MMRELDYWENEENNDSSESEDENSDGQSDQTELENNKKTTNQAFRPIAEEMMTGFDRLRQEEMFFDITIIAGTRKIRAHKIILCAASPYFNAMFTGSFVENNHDEVTVRYVDDEMIELLINYMYSGKLKFDSDNVYKILLAARFLQIDSAVNIALNHIKEKTSIKNCINLLCFAGKHSLNLLSESLIEFTVKNFDKLFMNENFSKIEFSEFQQIICDKRVIAYPPDIILCLIVRWVNYDYESRFKYLDELLKNLDPQHITMDLLNSEIILNRLNKCDFKKWYNKKPSLDVSILSNWDIAIFRHTENIKPELYKFNTQVNAKLKSLPRDYFDGSYIGFGGAIYHTGGCLSKKAVTTETQCLSIYKNVWKNFVNMKIGRAYHRNCIVDAQLYSVGGTDGGYSAFTSCEYIDLASARSIASHDLNKPRETMGLTVHNNVIYAIGGKNRGRCKYKCAERYDPRVGAWEMLKSVPYESGITSSVTIENDIYCLSAGKSLERYDIRGDFWTKIITQFKSYPIDMFTINNELYGLYGNNICWYDAFLGKWRSPSLRFRCERSNITAVTVLIAPRPNANENNDDDNNNENVNNDFDMYVAMV